MSALVFVSRSIVYQGDSKQSLIVKRSLSSVFVDESLLNLVTQRCAAGIVGKVVDSLLDDDGEPHRFFDLLGARPRIVWAAFESVVEALQDIVAFADPDADGLAAVVCHAPSKTCKDLKSCERVQTMDDTPLREQVRVGQGFACEQRRCGFGGSGYVDCGVVPAPAWEMIGTAAARLRLCSECRMYREIAERRESVDE